MLLIRTSERDASTNDVLDWLYYFNPDADITRLNDDRSITAISYYLSNEHGSAYIEADSGQTTGADIGTCWYRRGSLSVAQYQDYRYTETDKLPGLEGGLKRHLSRETQCINEAIDLHWGGLPCSINPRPIAM